MGKLQLDNVMREVTLQQNKLAVTFNKLNLIKMTHKDAKHYVHPLGSNQNKQHLILVRVDQCPPSLKLSKL